MPSKDKRLVPVRVTLAETGVFVGEFKSQTDAALELDISAASVLEVVTGRRKSTSGFCIEPIGEYIRRKSTVHLNPRIIKPVERIDPKPGEITYYNTITEGARATGCSPCHITRVCKGFKKTCYGFVWRYPKKDEAALSLIPGRKRLQHVTNSEIIV